MTTLKTGMRTILAATAAGALVLGSAGAATAHPHRDKAKGPKATVVAPADMKTKLTKVDIKRHKKIDVAKVDDSTALKLRAKVRYSGKVTDNAASVQVVPVTLAVYDKKVNGEMVDGTQSAPTELAIKDRKKAKKTHRYYGSAKVTEVWSPEQLGALAAYLQTNGKAYICISGVDGEFDKYSKQTRKRLDMNVKKTVRECVKVYTTAAPTT